MLLEHQQVNRMCETRGQTGGARPQSLSLKGQKKQQWSGRG